MGVTLAANFGIIDPSLLILEVGSIFKSFQLWRLVTPFLFHGKLGFPFLIHMMFLVRYGSSLEQTTFAGRQADYIFFLIFGCSILLIIGYLLHFLVMGMSLISMLIYLWSRKNPNMEMSFMFGLRFKSIYFPWVLVGFSVLLGGNPLPELVGIFVGHCYYFLEDIYPLTSGYRPLMTPQFLKEFFHEQTQQRNAFVPQQQRGNWGRGQRLGDQ